MNSRKNNLIKLIKGCESSDERGILLHNNKFDLSTVRRTYIIENKNLDYLRGWKGHNIENRWFICVKGVIKIFVATIYDLQNQNENYKVFELNENKMNVLHVPPGNATLIKQLNSNSRIMAFSDWLIGESDDENLRWPNNIFRV